MLEARFLGKFDIRINGTSIELPARKAQSLLAYLMMTRGTLHRREQLAGILWPDSEESSGRSRLRYTIWQLRKAVGEEYFVSDKISITFNHQEQYWLDCEVLETRQAEDLTTHDLADKLAVYEGEFLPGFYDDWILLTRDRLQSSFEQMMVLFLGRLGYENRWSAILEWAERWISFGTSPEPAYQALIVAHSRLGDKAGATSAYHRCQQSLGEQLGVEPAVLTTKIYELILAGEIPEVSLLYPAPPGPKIPPSLQPDHKIVLDRDERVFVTREWELAWLNEKLELALLGRGQAAFVVGDAGQGKTALLREFSQRAQQLHPDLIVANGSSEAYTGFGDPHLPFREILALLTGDIEIQQSTGAIDKETALRLWNLIPQSSEALVRYGPDLIESFIPGEALLRRASSYDSGTSAWLAELKNEVEQRKSRPVPLNIDHGDSKKALFDQYTRVLQILAGKHPLLLILDDLQWADFGTIGLLFHLARRIEGQRILVLGAYRQDDIAQYHAESQHPLVEVLAELKRIYGDMQIDLDEGEGRHFIEDYLDTEPNMLDDEFRQALFLQTAGHPLFTVELLRQMQDQEDIYKDGQGRWVKNPVLDWETLPARVEAVIERRVGRLPSTLNEILNIASVEGEEFSAEVIARVLNRDEIEIVRQLSQDLDKKHRLVEARGIVHVGQQRLSIYRFRHRLFQKFIYEDLDLVERSHLHQKVGDNLELIYGTHKAEIAAHLARHYEEAGEMEKTIDYLLQAGNQAKRVSANEQAVAYLGKGIDLLRELPGGKKRDEIELALQTSSGPPKVAIQGYASLDVEQTFERARQLSERTGDVEQLAPVLWGLCAFYQVRGKHAIAYEMANQILAVAEDGGDDELLLLAHWMLGTTLTHLGEFSSARDNLELALSKYYKNPDDNLTYTYGQHPAVTCLNYLAINLWVLGYPDQALEKCDEAVSLAHKIDHPYSQAFAHGMAALWHSIRRDEKSTLRHCEQTLKLAKESSFPFFLALGLILRGWGRVKSGKTGMAINLMKNGIEAMQIIGAELGRPYFLSLLAEGYQESGDLNEGLDAVQNGLKRIYTSKELWSEFNLCLLKGNLLRNINEGDNAKSNSWYKQGIKVARRQNAKSYELQAVMMQVEQSEDIEQLAAERAKLTGIYEWFTEGYDTDLLREAKELRDSTWNLII
jgi:predicted ATPase/DNA-binding SARP family transcriptional activator